MNKWLLALVQKGWSADVTWLGELNFSPKRVETSNQIQIALKMIGILKTIFSIPKRLIFISDWDIDENSVSINMSKINGPCRTIQVVFHFRSLPVRLPKALFQCKTLKCPAIEIFRLWKFKTLIRKIKRCCHENCYVKFNFHF